MVGKRTEVFTLGNVKEFVANLVGYGCKILQFLHYISFCLHSLALSLSFPIAAHYILTFLRLTQDLLRFEFDLEVFDREGNDIYHEVH